MAQDLTRRFYSHSTHCGTLVQCTVYIGSRAQCLQIRTARCHVEVGCDHFIDVDIPHIVYFLVVTRVTRDAFWTQCAWSTCYSFYSTKVARPCPKVDHPLVSAG